MAKSGEKLSNLTDFLLFCVKDVANLRQNGSILGAKKQKTVIVLKLGRKLGTKLGTQELQALSKMYICILL